MDYQLLKYQITPRVVKTNIEQTVSVKGLDRSCLFYDDMEYTVSVISVDNYSYKGGQEFFAGGRDTTTTYTVKPKDGVISFSHRYKSEGEWEIKIERTDKLSDEHVPERFIKYWKAGKNRIINGFAFFIYALNDDLYGKKPFKGDMHVHSFESDGWESPEFIASRYREHGYDFMSLTDHYFMSPSIDLVEGMKKVNGGLKLFVGEEVHPYRAGEVFHVVNFNGKTSVNQIYNDNPEKAQEEIKEIAKTIGSGNDVDDMELAHFKWIFDKIREGGGIAIYPHAFWHVNHSFNVRPSISYEILKRKLCDAFEIMGGQSKRDNRELVQYALNLKAKGIDLPFVASSDAHSSLKAGSVHFCDAYSIVFAKDSEDIPSEILNKNLVAIDNHNPDDKIAYGEYRLIHYVNFLFENYYPLHDDYCKAIGGALLRFVLGDKTQKDLIERLDIELKKYDKEFFGI